MSSETTPSPSPSHIFSDEVADDVRVVVYSLEYTRGVLGMSEEDIGRYGLPRALKYKGCDVLVPIPSGKSTRSSMKNLLRQRSQKHPEKSPRDLASDISTEMASSYFK